MKIFLIIFTTLLALLSSSKTFSFSKKSFLKGGFGITKTWIEGRNDSEDNYTSFGVNSHFGYRWIDWETNLSSNISIGKTHEIQFEANNNTIITGTGTARTCALGPTLRYLSSIEPLKIIELFKGWYLFGGGGPFWSLKTFKLQQYTSTGGNFRKDDKITYTTKGFTIFVGMEEKMLHKEEHPAYLDFSYSYNQARSISIVDASDSKKVETVLTESAIRHIRDHSLTFTLGITFF